MASKFEALPNEILIFLFEFLSVKDLCSSFYGLNHRFNSIVRSVSYRLNLKHVNRSEFEFYDQTVVPLLDHDRVESLQLNDVEYRFKTIVSFKELRSLTLKHLRTQTIEFLSISILPTLKKLQTLYLHSNFTIRYADVNCLIDTIISDQMPSLTYCHLSFENSNQIYLTRLTERNQSLSLKSLILDQWCRYDQFFRLLRALPNIERLTVRLYELSSDGYVLGEHDDNVQVKNSKLIYLRTKLASKSLIDVWEKLIRHLPTTLEELSISTWSENYIDHSRWEKMFVEHLFNLKHFRLIVSLDRIPSVYNEQMILGFNTSKYFAERRWKLIINKNETDHLPLVFHSLPYPIENFQTSLFNIKRSSIEPSLLSIAYRKVNRLSLILQNEDLSHIYDQECRCFTNVNHLIFSSDPSMNYLEFRSFDFLSKLYTIVNCSSIRILELNEENFQYPIDFVNRLLKDLPNLIELYLPYRTYALINNSSIGSSLRLVSLSLMTYESFRDILTTDLIVTLIQEIQHRCPCLETLQLSVPHNETFDFTFSQWLETKFSHRNDLTYDFIMIDRIVRFHL